MYFYDNVFENLSREVFGSPVLPPLTPLLTPMKGYLKFVFLLNFMNKFFFFNSSLSYPSFSSISRCKCSKMKKDEELQPPKKKSRLEEEYEDSFFWKHQEFFGDLQKKSFCFNNDWINSDSLVGSSKEENSIEMLIPSLVIYAAKKFGSISKRFVQINRHPKARFQI